MKFILDTADVKAIKELSEIITVDGVTTNPSIIARSNKDYKVVIDELVKLLKDDQKLFIQVVATDFDEIMKEAEWINSLRANNVYVKIPVTHVGLKAIKACKEKGYKVLATAIYSAEQGLMAAKNGADCLAPYVNRMCNFKDGIQDVLDLNQMLKVHNLDTYIVAASFKNTSQVHELLKGGVESVTVPVDVAYSMIDHPATDEAVTNFTKDWEKSYNKSGLL